MRTLAVVLLDLVIAVGLVLLGWLVIAPAMGMIPVAQQSWWAVLLGVVIFITLRWLRSPYLHEVTLRRFVVGLWVAVMVPGGPTAVAGLWQREVLATGEGYQLVEFGAFHERSAVGIVRQVGPMKGLCKVTSRNGMAGYGRWDAERGVFVLSDSGGDPGPDWTMKSECSSWAWVLG